MELRFPLHRLPKNQDRREFAPALIRVGNFQRPVFIVPNERRVILHERFIGKEPVPDKSGLEPVTLELEIEETLLPLDAWSGVVTYSFGPYDKEDIWSPELTHEVFFCSEYVRQFQIPFRNRDVPPRKDAASYLTGGILGWDFFNDHQIEVQNWGPRTKRVQVLVGDCLPKRKPK